IREPTFTDAQLEKVRGELMTGLREADQDTRSVAERTFRELAYPEGHPFRRRVAGYLETVPRIAVADLTAHHARTFRPDLSTIAAAGGVAPSDAFERLAAAFGDWAADGQAPLATVPPTDPPAEALTRTVELSGKSQADVVLGFPSIARTHPD